jgi:prepilin-type N-terminal cleavage/methylation domain-containing protein
VLGNTKTAPREQGFTLVELLVSITLMGFLSLAVFSISIYYFTQISRNTVTVELTTSSQNLLRTTVENLRYGAGVRQTNTISDANAPAGGWNTSNTNFIIIIAVPALDSNRNYIIDSGTGNPYNNELVYFKSGTTLMQRTLANPSAVGNNLKTSCPAASASSTCPADKELTENVSSMVFTMYDQDDIFTTNPLDARAVKIDLVMSRNTFDGAVSITNSIRSTFRNRYP